jgi:hypothetical protein
MSAAQRSLTPTLPGRRILISALSRARAPAPDRRQNGRQPAATRGMLCALVTAGAGRYQSWWLILRTTGAFSDQARDVAAVSAGQARVLPHAKLKLRGVSAELYWPGGLPPASHKPQSVACRARGLRCTVA